MFAVMKASIRPSLKVFLIIIGISLAAGIPLTVFSMPGSMHLAESIYQEVSLVVHVKSPGQIVIGDDGVPVVDYGYKNGQHLGKQSNL